MARYRVDFDAPLPVADREKLLQYQLVSDGKCLPIQFLALPLLRLDTVIGSREELCADAMDSP
jgi:hypothetical protein